MEAGFIISVYGSYKTFAFDFSYLVAVPLLLLIVVILVVFSLLSTDTVSLISSFFVWETEKYVFSNFTI